MDFAGLWPKQKLSIHSPLAELNSNEVELFYQDHSCVDPRFSFRPKLICKWPENEACAWKGPRVIEALSGVCLL